MLGEEEGQDRRGCRCPDEKFCSYALAARAKWIPCVLIKQSTLSWEGQKVGASKGGMVADKTGTDLIKNIIHLYSK